ncbi:hypothetical protein BN1180_02590 [Peribacillus simplex]|uniref:Uncharacterized protein n=1 Tax=Peribacillus simplex TaxID=1478 RepID=A0AAN2PHV2_9BACI|nr:hypothetical protein CQ056_07065 [Peribacillus simplex]CEG32429.1 hypothetical protein BN1180_02590 [Peribacillus simplex]
MESSQTVDKLQIEFVLFYDLYNLDVDWNVGHSLSAGGRGASSAFACGVSLGALFPQEYRSPAPINFDLPFR